MVSFINFYSKYSLCCIKYGYRLGVGVKNDLLVFGFGDVL